MAAVATRPHARTRVPFVVVAGALFVPGLGYVLVPLLIPLPLLYPLVLGRPVHGNPAGATAGRWVWLAAGALALPLVLFVAFFVTSRG